MIVVVVIGGAHRGGVPLAPGPGPGSPSPPRRALGLADAYIVVSQYRHHHVADFLWPEHFARVNLLGLAAIFLLLAEAARDLLVPDPTVADDRARPMSRRPDSAGPDCHHQSPDPGTGPA